MDAPQLDTPILFVVFNRPETTAQVFEQIRLARPRQLFVTADGPRPHKPADAERCAQARAIATAVDWPCEVKTRFLDNNVGCREGVSGGISWFFEHVEQGIILEDDCVPHPDFFPYCQLLLHHYAADPRVMMISGNNFLRGDLPVQHSYWFSRYALIWGWATWRRAWQQFDVQITRYPEFRDQGLIRSVFLTASQQQYWQRRLDRTWHGTLNSAWALQWSFSCWANNGINIIPNRNLVSNVGFGVESAHTNTSRRDIMAFVPTDTVLPLRHPRVLLPDMARDLATYHKVFRRTKVQKGWDKIIKLLEDKRILK